MTFESWQTSLYRCCSFLTRNPDTADDLLQEVSVERCRHDHDKGNLPTIAWLKTKARFLFTDALRRRRAATIALDVELASRSEPPDVSLERKEVATKVRKAIGSLPTNYQTVVFRVFFDGLTGAELAQELGRSEATIRTWKKRALRLLQANTDGAWLI